ncbi:DUF2249 domain-containing protein [Martelella soudanensis]|uniref:DUF2249 domain-containing protein n=1 Tax=unclassified Martelella TaxID=2629616 RepID=UPI0015DD5781|nr:MULTISPECIES: DUF2249 domain-containing protein [unclassified Martelella]
MREQALSKERVVDVREIGPSVRHTVITQLVTHLAAGETLQLIVDHDPRRLKLQLEAGRDGGICWEYLEKGPDIWRVRLGRGAST